MVGPVDEGGGFSSDVVDVTMVGVDDGITWTRPVERSGKLDCSVDVPLEGRAKFPFADAESFAASTLKITHPMVLMVTGRMSVQGKRNMLRFSKLFPNPSAVTPLA